MNYPRVSVIILNWNGLEDTIECLESLKKITYPNYEVIVVDNGSKGNDAEVLQEKFGDYIHLIRNHKNFGYTGGNNIGIRYAVQSYQSDYSLILNNDTIVDPHFLYQLVITAESDASIGIVGPKVYYSDFPNTIQIIGGKINIWMGRTSSIGSRQLDLGQYEEQQEMDFVSGCCLLVKNKVIQMIGLFDEQFFCYWDETDYCYRVTKSGLKIVYCPRATVWHKSPLRKERWKLWQRSVSIGRRGTSAYYYMARNNFIFMKKHASRIQYLCFLVTFFGCHLWFITGVCLLYHRNIKWLRDFHRGARDGIFTSPSRT